MVPVGQCEISHGWIPSGFFFVVAIMKFLTYEPCMFILYWAPQIIQPGPGGASQPNHDMRFLSGRRKIWTVGKGGLPMLNM